MYREVAPLKQNLELKIALPGSKSITNRAFLCAALARGKSVIKGALLSDDTQVMMKALQKLGIKFKKNRAGDFEIQGTAGKFTDQRLTLNLGNAGTATRFLTAIMTLRQGPTVITGDERMQERPIRDLVDALTQLGAEITYQKKSGYPPLLIKQSAATPPRREVPRCGGVISSQQSAEYTVTLRGDQSSQYVSAMLLLGPLLKKPLRLMVEGVLASKPYVKTTLAVMKAFGIACAHQQFKEFYVEPQTYQPAVYFVEGDASAASYWHSLNYLHGGHLEFQNLGRRSIQGDVHYPEALKQLGKGDIDMNEMPDVAMTLAVTAPFAKGETVIRNVPNLRIKETDRLAALETELKKVGVLVQAEADAIRIKPLGHRMDGLPETPSIETYNDHRMAMCFAVLGTKIPGIRILNPACTTKTYPHFWDDLERAYLAPISLVDRNVVLIGMRGSGKNHLGQKIASLLGRPFIDLDDRIRLAAGAEYPTQKNFSIKDVINGFGWDYFRKIEQKICSEMAGVKKSVIATGGGVILNPLNMRILKEDAVTIFVFANPPVLAQRIAQGQERPPLIAGQTATSEVEEIWRKRRDLYLQYADFVWDNTSGKVIAENLKKIFI